VLPPNDYGERRVYDVADPSDARLAVVMLTSSGIEAELHDEDDRRFVVGMLAPQRDAAERILERWAPGAVEVGRPAVEGAPEDEGGA
jgi:hypothetical protein